MLIRIAKPWCPSRSSGSPLPVATHLGLAGISVAHLSIANLSVAIIPVFVFLFVLVLMDSFKLVRPGTVVVSIGIGGGVALACLLLHSWMVLAGVPRPAIRYYVAPLTEETLKAAFIVFLIARRRVGFLVDAAVQGFAVGAGFAIVENIDYFRSASNPALLLWIARGFGTAILHGSTTSIFAMLAKSLSDRHPESVLRGWVPAWAVAVIVHAAFNNAPLPAIAKTLLMLILMPALALFVFQRSERATREWVGAGLDLDIELLQLVGSEHFGATRFGAYLYQLKERFDGPIVADMFCLLRVELELSVRAKAMLLARQAGLRVPVDDDLYASLAELEYVRSSIGTTGLLALKPLQVTSHRDEWHRYLLKGSKSKT
jgi:RsiW-degrading membrane proteinase PrsW (M82 family)